MTPSCDWASFYHGGLVLRASGETERQRENERERERGGERRGRKLSLGL